MTLPPVKRYASFKWAFRWDIFISFSSCHLLMRMNAIVPKACQKYEAYERMLESRLNLHFNDDVL